MLQRMEREAFFVTQAEKSIRKTYALELPGNAAVKFPVVAVGAAELAFKFKPQAAGRA